MNSKGALTAALAVLSGWFAPSLGAAAGGPSLDYAEGMYCRLDVRRGQFMTLLVSVPDAQGRRYMRVEDNRPIDVAASPALHQISCTLAAARFQCRWGAGGALELETDSARLMKDASGYYLVVGRWRDLPRTGTRLVDCYVKAARAGPTLD